MKRKAVSPRGCAQPGEYRRLTPFSPTLRKASPTQTPVRNMNPETFRDFEPPAYATTNHKCKVGSRARCVPQNYTDVTKWRPQHPVRSLQKGVDWFFAPGGVTGRYVEARNSSSEDMPGICATVQQADERSRGWRGKPLDAENATQRRNLALAGGGGQLDACFLQWRARHARIVQAAQCTAQNTFQQVNSKLEAK